MPIRHRTIRTNGINMHIAEAGTGYPVVMLHGFPELWYSWRQQLPAVAEAGFHAVAPDLRGFGDTDAPPDSASYAMKERVADVIGLLDALHANHCVLVGHDWGANLAWACAQLFPQRIAALFILSVPYKAREDEPPSAVVARFAGDKFSFSGYFQRPGVAEVEFERDPKASLRRFYYALSGDAPPGLVAYLFTQKPATAGVLEGMPDPQPLPAWLTEADLDVFAQAYRRTGFRSPLNLYRTMDQDWQELPQLGVGKLVQPTVFMGGKLDPPVLFGQFDPMIAAVPKLRKIIFVESAGHWLQQERAAAVNEELLDFLRREQF
ncbi:MAG: alpha/beta hydrolase [Caldilinea sp. CFX5]|nr:alpha/beta hydrolase [Caldilinea sp. CFX5]